MDTCVIPLRFGGLSLLQTTDFFYPIVDDPYMMVRVLFSCACGCVMQSCKAFHNNNSISIPNFQSSKYSNNSILSF